MNDKPARTGSTTLTDAELLLFDFLFQHHVRRQALERDTYEIHMNCAYSHGLDSDELGATLNSLVERKLIWARMAADPDESSYTLTAAGGALWERERRPNWDRYVESRQSYRGDRQSALATNESISRQCLGMGFAFNVFVAGGPIQTKVVRRCNLLPWRVFDHVHVASVRIRPRCDANLDAILINHEAYDSCRTWWQTVHELNTLNHRIR